jgi:hypothetical protein
MADPVPKAIPCAMVLPIPESMPPPPLDCGAGTVLCWGAGVVAGLAWVEAGRETGRDAGRAAGRDGAARPKLPPPPRRERAMIVVLMKVTETREREYRPTIQRDFATCVCVCNERNVLFVVRTLRVVLRRERYAESRSVIDGQWPKERIPNTTTTTTNTATPSSSNTRTRRA